MVGKTSPEGECSSGITLPPESLENGPPGSPSRKSLLVSYLDLPNTASVTIQQQGQRLFGACSVLIQGSVKDTEAQGELVTWPRPCNSQASCRPRAPGSWQRLLPEFYTENAWSLLQTYFLLWAQSQCDRKLWLFTHLTIGGSRV